MCGIIGFIPKNNKSTQSGKEVVTQYQRQLSRGQRGFGLISIYADKVEVDRATEPTKIILDSYMSKAPIQFFHHRMPTSTSNEMEQTHPFLVSHDELAFDYYLIHNGVIRNADALMKIHTEELGYAYTTLSETVRSQYYTTKEFNDSEALAVEAARYFDGKSKEIGALGTIAFIIVRMDKKTHAPVDVIWSRNSGNPIEMVETKEGLLIASEVYHDDAELVPENTFEIIDLNKYFKAKTAHKSIIKLIKAGEATYSKPPAPPPPAPYVKPSTSTMGFHSTAIPAKTSTNATVKETPKDDERETGTPRERAFAKMAERVVDDISDQIYGFFEELAYNDVNETEIIQVANDLMDMLIEKAESARDKVRPFFDKREDKDDMSNLDPDADVNEEDIEAYNRSSLSLSERADASSKRFGEIMF